MLKRIFLIFVLVSFLLFLLAQNAQDITFYKSGYSIEKMLEFNKMSDINGLCFDSEDNLLVVDYYGQVFKVSPNGTVLRVRFCGPGYSAEGMYYDIKINPINQEIIVGGSQGVYKFYITTGKLEQFSSDGAYHLAFDNSGNLYTSYSKTLTKYLYQNSGYELEWTKTFAFQIEGIAVDSAGNIYMSDFYRGKIIKLDSSGKRTDFDSGLVHPRGMALHTSGDLFVIAEDPSSPPEAGMACQMIVRIPSGFSTYKIVAQNIPYCKYITLKNNEIFASLFSHGIVRKYDLSGNFSNYTHDYGLPMISKMRFDLIGNPILSSFRLGRIYRVNENNQVEVIAGDAETGQGAIDSIEINDQGELYCFKLWVIPDDRNQLIHVPLDGSSPTVVKNFPSSLRSPAMKFLNRDNKRLVLSFSVSSPLPQGYELYEYDVSTGDSGNTTKIATNLSNSIPFTLDDENNIYVRQGVNEGIKKAAYPTPPFVLDMNDIPNYIILKHPSNPHIQDPYSAIRYIDVSANHEVFIPVGNPEGEIYIGPAEGGIASCLASGFLFPQQVAFDRYGRLWVLDRDNGLFKITNQESIVSRNIKNCDHLMEEVEGSGIPGIKQSLIAKLRNAKKSLENGNLNAAIGQILAFKNEVEDQKGEAIPEDKANRWISIASGMSRALKEAS